MLILKNLVNPVYYLAMVEAVLVVCDGTLKSGESGTFSIVNLIKSSTTALRSFVS